jgi:hypothetical protein
MRENRPTLPLWLWIGAATLLLLIPLPSNPVARSWPALWHELENFSHPVVFAWLTHVVHERVQAHRPAPARFPYAWFIGAACTFAAATELLQTQLGRDGSWEDATHDLLGVAFALLLHARADCKPARSRLTLAVMATATGIAAAAPLGLTIAAYAVRSAQAPVLWKADSNLLARFAHAQGNPYPGLAIDEPLPDWRSYRGLEVAVENPQSVPLALVVRVHDRTHNGSYEDRYNGEFTLQPKSATVLHISLSDIRAAPASRAMDLARIQGVMIFGEPQEVVPGFTLQEVRLTR